MSDIEAFNERREKICVVGLGYVGLPLAVLLARKFKVCGFDLSGHRLAELGSGFDHTGEITPEALKSAGLELSGDPSVIASCRVVIVTVPTPIDKNKNPDLGPILDASRTIGLNLRPGSVVVYESTVYPGLTEGECVPILERESGLKWKKDFNVGYSPERVNPGDTLHTIEKIVKVVSGDTPETGDFLQALYGSVITAGIHRAPDIKTAEAAKAIENTQRDLNIALMNELSIIFDRMDIDTHAVLAAARTKWNFLAFEPGLVGGHCIGVDPYYLTFKSQSLGYHPQVILAGREINDGMGRHIAEHTVKCLVKSGRQAKNASVLILGITFKENISDIRNTRVIDIYRELTALGATPHIYDPHADPARALKEYGIELIPALDKEKPYDAIIFAVRHSKFIETITLGEIMRLSRNGKAVLIDIKGVFNRANAEKLGITYWRL